MRHKFYLYICAVFVLLASSCDGDDPYEDVIYQQWVTAYLNADKYAFVPDDGVRLTPTREWQQFFPQRDSARVLLGYGILEQPGAKQWNILLVNAQEILTKNMVRYNVADTAAIGSNAIQIRQAFVSGNYLTIEYGMWFDNKSHLLNLVEMPRKTEDGAVQLEFKHNSYGDGLLNWGVGYVAFYIQGLQEKDKPVIDIELSYVDYLGITRTLDLVYDQRVPSSQSTPSVKAVDVNKQSYIPIAN